MILGVYYLSAEQKNKIGEGTIFASTAEVLKAYTLGQVHPHSIVGITTNNYPQKKFPHEGTLITTVGKIILNNVLPDNMVYVNDVNVDENTVSKTDVIGHGENVREAIAN
jgi:DNA-directed RNA polymerase subunit beta'